MSVIVTQSSDLLYLKLSAVNNEEKVSIPAEVFLESYEDILDNQSAWMMGVLTMQIALGSDSLYFSEKDANQYIEWESIEEANGQLRIGATTAYQKRVIDRNSFSASDTFEMLNPSHSRRGQIPASFSSAGDGRLRMTVPWTKDDIRDGDDVARASKPQHKNKCARITMSPGLCSYLDFEDAPIHRVRRDNSSHTSVAGYFTFFRNIYQKLRPLQSFKCTSSADHTQALAVDANQGHGDIDIVIHIPDEYWTAVAGNDGANDFTNSSIINKAAINGLSVTEQDQAEICIYRGNGAANQELKQALGIFKTWRISVAANGIVSIIGKLNHGALLQAIVANDPDAHTTNMDIFVEDPFIRLLASKFQQVCTPTFTTNSLTIQQNDNLGKGNMVVRVDMDMKDTFLNVDSDNQLLNFDVPQYTALYGLSRSLNWQIQKGGAVTAKMKDPEEFRGRRDIIHICGKEIKNDGNLHDLIGMNKLAFQTRTDNGTYKVFMDETGVGKGNFKSVRDGGDSDNWSKAVDNSDADNWGWWDLHFDHELYDEKVSEGEVVDLKYFGWTDSYRGPGIQPRDGVQYANVPFLQRCYEMYHDYGAPNPYNRNGTLTPQNIVWATGIDREGDREITLINYMQPRIHQFLINCINDPARAEVISSMLNHKLDNRDMQIWLQEKYQLKVANIQPVAPEKLIDQGMIDSVNTHNTPLTVPGGAIHIPRLARFKYIVGKATRDEWERSRHDVPSEVEEAAHHFLSLDLTHAAAGADTQAFGVTDTTGQDRLNQLLDFLKAQDLNTQNYKLYVRSYIPGITVSQAHSRQWMESDIISVDGNRLFCSISGAYTDPSNSDEAKTTRHRQNMELFQPSEWFLRPYPTHVDLAPQYFTNGHVPVEFFVRGGPKTVMGQIYAEGLETCKVQPNTPFRLLQSDYVNANYVNIDNMAKFSSIALTSSQGFLFEQEWASGFKSPVLISLDLPHEFGISGNPNFDITGVSMTPTGNVFYSAEGKPRMHNMVSHSALRNGSMRIELAPRDGGAPVVARLPPKGRMDVTLLLVRKS